MSNFELDELFDQATAKSRSVTGCIWHAPGRTAGNWGSVGHSIAYVGIKFRAIALDARG